MSCGVDKLIRYSRFQGVGNLTLHFPDNFGGDTTQIYYIGLKGEATQVCKSLGGVFLNVKLGVHLRQLDLHWIMLFQLKRDVVATIVYEITPNPSDHK